MVETTYRPDISQINPDYVPDGSPSDAPADTPVDTPVDASADIPVDDPVDLNVTAHHDARQALLDWQADKQTSFYQRDPNLQQVLHRLLDAQRMAAVAPQLEALGEAAATTMDASAREEDFIGNHPQLDRWSAMGVRQEAIRFHPAHHVTGEVAWRSGIMLQQSEPGHTVEQMALFYLLSHNGEAGALCSITCTAGLIRALQMVGDDELRARFLPPLLSDDYATRQHGAQFMTEVQGGSDVGANAVVASPADDGTWRIHGEKWFCSNIDADQYLMTARVVEGDTHQPVRDGTRGLGLFLVPRRLDDGSVNHFAIRRLKDKLGTRTLASAEVDFAGAVAYAVGDVEHGFRSAVNWVLNTSRLMNAVACAGVMQRATLEAVTYARHRSAFGRPIIEYPLVQEAIAELRSETAAATASSFAIAHLVDLLDTGRADATTDATYRLLVNINKMITSVRGSQMVHRAIEVLGGNGAIESFSILPRLYRDMVVLESWEGTHNVLCLQVLRDAVRYRVHEGWALEMRNHLYQITDPDMAGQRATVEAALDAALATFTRLEAQSHTQGEAFAQAHARRWVEQLAVVTQAVLLLAEAHWSHNHAPDLDKPQLAAYFIDRHLTPGYDPLHDDTYLQRVRALALG